MIVKYSKMVGCIVPIFSCTASPLTPIFLLCSCAQSWCKHFYLLSYCYIPCLITMSLSPDLLLCLCPSTIYYVPVPCRVTMPLPCLTTLLLASIPSLCLLPSCCIPTPCLVTVSVLPWHIAMLMSFSCYVPVSCPIATPLLTLCPLSLTCSLDFVSTLLLCFCSLF